MGLSKWMTGSWKKRNLITFSNPDSKVSDQFRTIRTNISFLTETKKNRIFLITSPGKGEGKSTTTANLAVSMAQQDEKVLLIDADLRQPRLHMIFRLSNTLGLTDILTAKCSLEEAVQQTGIGSLEVLASGPTLNNPVELLSNQQMSDLLGKVTEAYDIVLIDSPTILHSTETRLLANQCGGVVLVLNRGKTVVDRAVEAKKVLEFARAELVGTILTEK